MAKPKAKPQTTAELRKEIRKYLNPVVARVNEHVDEFDRLAGVLNVVSADRMATQIDLEAETRRIDSLAKADEALAHRIDNEREWRHRNEIHAIERIQALEARDRRDRENLSTFGARLRWLLTGK